MTDITWRNETRRLDELVPWEHNPKRMTKKQAEGLRLSIERFGFAVPFLVSPDGDIYDGHQRQTLMGAIKQYGPNATVDVRVSSRPLSDDERRELVVRLKQNQAGWDFDMLPNLYEREELLEWGFEPEELGMFPADDVADDPGAQIDRAEELREKWGVVTGQLWQLGEHRLICGDCTDSQVVARVMDGERAALAPVDPPYNVGIEYGDTVDDAKHLEDYEAFSRAWLGLCQSVSERQIVTPGRRNIERWCRWFDAKTIGAWTKNNAINRGKTSMFACWEPVFFFGEKWKRTRANDLFDFPVSNQGGVANHPCPKPLPMWEDLLTHYSEPGDLIYEAFSGSGTTLIACERLGRRCRACEIEPSYVGVALERFYQMTGIEPVLLGSSDFTVISNG